MKKPVAIEIISGRWVEIKYPEATRGDAMGEYTLLHSGPRIEINKALEGRISFSTLIHEMTHAGLCANGMDQLFTTKQQEAICTSNEMIFSHILKLDMKSKHIKWANFGKDD